jgi:cathepsin B
MSLGRVRNQGDCGACYAFAAVEVLADRECIEGGDVNFTGSVEYMLRCDGRDSGCDGGLLDDAWRFLVDTGVPSETCVPYTHCLHPEKRDCVAGVSGAGCPSTCSGPGLSLLRVRATSAYAVAAPGDVEAMQREIFRHGPIEAGFFIFSDFLNFKNGTYFRTPSATGPLGGHAVRVLGWGVDSAGVAYWLCANSWSAQWGNEGFFQIRRGTNECAIETTAAAGLVSTERSSSGMRIFA